jgi:hypothetical protein
MTPCAPSASGERRLAASTPERPWEQDEGLSRPEDEPPRLDLYPRRPGAGRTGATLARCRRARRHRTTIIQQQERFPLMATLHTPMSLSSSPRPPSRPRMNSTLTLVTPEKAQALLATAYQGQRPLRPHHVRFLRHLMRTGHWRQGAEIHCARIDSERFLINGQHTLTALVQEHLAAWLTLVEIDVPTLAAIGRLYESFDRNLTRSLDDIYQSDPAMRQYAWTGKQLKAMSGAVAVLATGYAKDALFADILLTLRDPFVRAELIRDWSGEATEAFGAMQGQLRRQLLRSGVLSVLLATYRYAGPQAAQFWPAVCHDSGLTEGMPARALVHFLLTTPSRMMGAPEYARHVASAWNAFYEQHALRTIVPRAGANPIRIAGTPHDGTATWQYLDRAGLVQHTPVPAPQPAAEEA